MIIQIWEWAKATFLFKLIHFKNIDLDNPCN